MSDVTVAPDATLKEEPRATVARLQPAPRVPVAEPMPTFEPDAGSVLYAANVETPRRDSMRRRALAVADVLALVGAYGVLWLLAPPPNSVTHDLVLLVALPLWVVLNKSLACTTATRTSCTSRRSTSCRSSSTRSRWAPRSRSCWARSSRA